MKFALSRLFIHNNLLTIQFQHLSSSFLLSPESLKRRLLEEKAEKEGEKENREAKRKNEKSIRNFLENRFHENEEFDEQRNAKENMKRKQREIHLELEKEEVRGEEKAAERNISSKDRFRDEESMNETSTEEKAHRSHTFPAAKHRLLKAQPEGIRILQQKQVLRSNTLQIT
ncbi:uncharacterized protein MONOS_15291 [Monocercomonoides exilis]|uniref:uncharacterized protein n=1 Tax=Monocercomonoides exilis TaxID=2049356 RepID=UPI00355A4C6D|nr:hypothetical protein MONOS_15291 [Monocercomonoides exilis]|eukprot:MONOS_15291.1-p1 / transcript=MONOS_15291.1 / gene=MONOS_15291 / organism=Monocercomonoides_exilis_PA203 / gene_product=unspecified product / transcript_product=unspecified product / location=Mono_scaffold01191:2617-3230(-) / protein_length=172 / sequence_SO=supercontig / SO=protein_coding / is_pseudo=false